MTVVAVEKPVRIQRKRVKGWRVQSPNGLPVVYVGRPSIFGNPFVPGEKANLIAGLPPTVDKRHAYLLFAAHAPLNEKLVEAAKKELRGKNLMCYCPLDHDCHADVLLELANRKEGQTLAESEG
jgi:hypothetical protein